jgi:DNA repair protein RadC
MPLKKEFVMSSASSTPESSTDVSSSSLEQTIMAAAEDILREKLERKGRISRPTDAADFLRMRLGALPHEEFHVLWLDTRHRILDCQRLFVGTIDGASIYPREVVRAALGVNASAAIFAHNHPSGEAEPSAADRAITRELREALQLVGVRVLDHLIIGAECVSMASRGLMQRKVSR